MQIACVIRIKFNKQFFILKQLRTKYNEVLNLTLIHAAKPVIREKS